MRKLLGLAACLLVVNGCVSALHMIPPARPLPERVAEVLARGPVVQNATQDSVTIMRRPVDLYLQEKITIAGTPIDGDICFFQVYRDVEDGNDTAGEDARLIGIKLFITTDAGTDA